MKQQIYNTGIYLRLSCDDDVHGESVSISNQRQMLTQYCREHGLRLVDEYVDDGYSGTNFDRPSFQRMLDDIENGKINCVVTKDLQACNNSQNEGQCPLHGLRGAVSSSQLVQEYGRRHRKTNCNVFPRRREGISTL